MSDFAITTTETEPRVDTRWRASRHGQFVAESGMLDVSKFVAGTHFNIGSRKDNVIPSGVFVELDPATKMYKPWTPAPADVWSASTSYEVGDRVSLPTGEVLVVTDAGTSGSDAPTAPNVAATVTDGTVTWEREADTAPIAGVINDNQGIDVFRKDGTRSPKAPFARLIHGFIEAKYLPIAAQATAAPAAETTAQISFV